MGRKSILTRTGYLSLALILSLATAPLTVFGDAYADTLNLDNDLALNSDTDATPTTDPAPATPTDDDTTDSGTTDGDSTPATNVVNDDNNNDNDNAAAPAAAAAPMLRAATSRTIDSLPTTAEWMSLTDDASGVGIGFTTMRPGTTTYTVTDITSNATNIVEVSGNTTNGFALTPKAVGRATITVYGQNGNRTRQATFTVYVYNVATTELWLDASAGTYTFAGISTPSGQGPANAIRVSASSNNRNAVEIRNADRPNNWTLRGAGDATITYTLSAGNDQNVARTTVDVTAHVYTLVLSKDEATVAKGYSGEYHGIVVAGNAAALTASSTNTSVVSAASLGSFTAAEAGDATIEFYAGQTKAGELLVHVYDPLTPDDVTLSTNGLGGAPTDMEFTVSGTNLPSWTLTSGDTSIVTVSEELTSETRLVAQTKGSATMTIQYLDDFEQPTKNFGATVIEVLPEITLSETEIYVLKGEAQPATITATSTEGTALETRVLKDGDEVAQADSIAVSVSGETYSLTVNKAGQYELEFAAVHDGNILLTKNVTVYAIDFTVNPQELHIVKGNSQQNTVTALNDFWNTTDFADETGFIISRLGHSDSDFEFRLGDDLEAGDYELVFYAIANGEIRDSKTVTVHVYEIKVTNHNNGGEILYGEVGTQFRTISVTDGNRNATQTMTIDGPENGLRNNRNRFTARKAGKYTVTYTDTMANGEQVGEYVVTIEVFGLSLSDHVSGIYAVGELSSEDELFTIDEAGTYGEVEATYEVDTGNGYESIDAFDPTQEGHYRVTVRNKTAAEHNFREQEQFTFYLYAIEADDLYIVRKGEGTTIDISTESMWSIDRVRDESASWYQQNFGSTDWRTLNDDGTVTIVADELDLGEHEISFQHNFGWGRYGTIKTAHVIVYDVTTDEEYDPEEITADTLESLFEALVGLTNMFNDVDPSTLTEEEFANLIQQMIDAERALITQAVGIFEDETPASVNALMEALMEGYELRTEVSVQIIDEADASEELVAAVREINPDVTPTYFDISVYLYGGRNFIGAMHQLTAPLTIALMETEEPAEGYARQYVLVAQHGDEEPILLYEHEDFEIIDGVIYLMSDRFSTFAVTYVDTLLPVAPNTGRLTTDAADGATADASVVMAAVISLATLLGLTTVALKRKEA